MPSFADAAGIAVIVSGLVAYVRYEFPQHLTGMRALALVWLLAPLVSVLAHEALLTPTASTQEAITLGLQAALIANGGYAAGRTATRRAARRTATPMAAPFVAPSETEPPTMPIVRAPGWELDREV